MSVHKALYEWNRKKISGLYMSSLFIKNENIPLLEEYFGTLDYDWLLKLTKTRKSSVIEPCVIRYVNGENLSLTSDYRRADFYMVMLKIDGNVNAMKRLCGSRARYHYYLGEVKVARYWFRHSNLNWKTGLYYISSYFPLFRKYIIKKFRVFG